MVRAEGSREGCGWVGGGGRNEDVILAGHGRQPGPTGALGRELCHTLGSTWREGGLPFLPPSLLSLTIISPQGSSYSAEDSFPGKKPAGAVQPTPLAVGEENAGWETRCGRGTNTAHSCVNPILTLLILNVPPTLHANKLRVREVVHFA